MHTSGFDLSTIPISLLQRQKQRQDNCICITHFQQQLIQSDLHDSLVKKQPQHMIKAWQLKTAIRT